jgi:SAM-dependent methyltransferase
MEPRSNVEWAYWGKRDPLWGVASWPGRERTGAKPWTDADFYALGESDWKDFLAHWQRYGLSTTRCVEIGCGAGRITRAMSRTFDRVDGTDISAEMLDYAREHVHAANVVLHQTTGADIPLPDGCAGAVFSTHVFQHLDSLPDARRLFAEAFRVLEPDGTMKVHLPLFAWPALGTRLAKGYDVSYRLVRRLGDLRAAVVRWQIRRGHDAKLMRGRAYNLDWLRQNLSGIGFADVEFSAYAVRSNGGMHTFVLARKPA